MHQYQVIVFTKFKEETEEVSNAIRKLSELANAKTDENKTAELEATITAAGILGITIPAQSASQARIMALGQYPDAYIWCTENSLDVDNPLYSLLLKYYKTSSSHDK